MYTVFQVPVTQSYLSKLQNDIPNLDIIKSVYNIVKINCVAGSIEWEPTRGPGASFSKNLKNLKSSSDLKHGKDNGYHGDKWT